MKTCPYCGTEADSISAKPEELPSWPMGMLCKWWPKVKASSEHLIGGKACLRKRLTRSEARRTFMNNALGDFRCAVLDDTYLPDEIRDAVLGHLDDCFSPIEEET